MKKRYIGVFDSGVGGLTAVKHLIEQLPGENIVFLADTENMPYGTKSRKQIIECSLHDFDTLNRYDLKAVLIACNTADSAARKTLQRQSEVPVIGVIEAAAKEACAATGNGKVGIMATSATVRSGEYEKRIHSLNSGIEVYSLACPELAEMIEAGKSAGEGELGELLKKYLGILKEKQIDTLVLGCTHYDVLKEEVRKLLPEINVISSSFCAIGDLKELLEKRGLLDEDPDPERIYLVTGDPEAFKRTASAILDDIEINKA